MTRQPFFAAVGLLLLLLWPVFSALASDDFEKNIRPLLVEKCQSCHGEKKAKGGLRLDSRAAMLKGGDTGPAIVPGKPGDSLLIKAVGYSGDLKMPPKEKLSPKEIEHLTQWIAQGALWPGRDGSAFSPSPSPFGKFTVSTDQQRWWAFQPLRSVKTPTVRNISWPREPLDRFILAELEKRDLSPTTEAERRVLLRRVTFDLTGLPPTPDEVDAFLGDNSPNAYAHVVDRLLASPTYGQHLARRWLDIVRYADYHDGNPNARAVSCEPLNAWRFRDWVVRAFNADLPFDRFIVHHIAGDLLPSPDGAELYEDGLVASTFLTNGSWDRGDADKEKMVSDMVDDQIDTIGKAFLGITLGCARCHDHKFDPISQADYYGLAGIFYSTRILQELGAKGGEYTLQRIPLVPKAYLAKRSDQLRQLNDLNAKIAALDKKNPGSPATVPGGTRGSLSPPPSPDDQQRAELMATRSRLQAELLPEPPMADAAQEGGTPGGLFPKIQDVPIHIRGSYTRLGPIVPRGLPLFLAGHKQPRISTGSGRRELANWIASRDNPLTARVIVNRVWQWHLGLGLVRTPNNFGMLSEPPTHPDLLDHLASTFLEDGWSMKKLQRRILLSATYRQASRISAEGLHRDPENQWLGRYSARRVEAEAIRDAMLFAAGRLDLTHSGPATHDLNTSRRSLYVQTARFDRSNFAALFDAANPDASVERRDISIVAPQALFLLNHDFPLTQAKHLADRVLRDEPTDEVARVHRLFRLVFGRPATKIELQIARRLISNAVNRSPTEPIAMVWRDLAHVVLCSNELITID